MKKKGGGGKTHLLKFRIGYAEHIQGILEARNPANLLKLSLTICLKMTFK